MAHIDKFFKYLALRLQCESVKNKSRYKKMRQVEKPASSFLGFIKCVYVIFKFMRNV